MKRNSEPKAERPVQEGHKRSWIAPAAACTLLMAVALCACMTTQPMPASDATTIEVVRAKSGLAKGDAGYGETLQILWFGSACHEIRLGDLSVVTDPFVSNGPLLKKLVSRQARVDQTLGKLLPPAVVLVNHGHHDHLLDAPAALSLGPWKDARVPLFGGKTSVHILAGWRDDDIDLRCHPVTGGKIELKDHVRLPAGCTLKVTAYRGEHSPHFGRKKVFFDGFLDSDLTRIPDSLADFKCGEVWNYLLEMSHGGVTFKVFILGGPGDPTELPTNAGPVDVVILPSPGAEKVERAYGHPLKEHFARLKPRHVVINHFNSMSEDDSGEQLSVLNMDKARLQWLSREIQAIVSPEAHPQFEKLHFPAYTRMNGQGRASNVIRIRKD